MNLETDDRVVPYIPFSCSLTWRQCRSSEVGPVNVHVAFNPDWYRLRTELDYGERWHIDPAYRRASLARMASVLNEEFALSHAPFDPGAVPESISQAFTCAVMAAAFGQGIRYAENDYPWNDGERLSDEEAEALEMPDVRTSWIFREVLRQLDVVERDSGLPGGVLNYQGVLNTAFRIRGESLFADMIENPRRAHRVLDVVCRTMIAFIDGVYDRQGRSGVVTDHFVTSNCVVNMLSGAQYREFVMPYDLELAGHFPSFGVHNCGWCVDAYTDAYAELGHLRYLDFGLDSDLVRIRRRFGEETTLTPIFNPSDIAGQPKAAVERQLRRLHDEIGECQIVLGGLGAELGAEPVRDLFEAISRVWAVPVEQLSLTTRDSF